ncbi:unnamed protein product, partial [Onchocerca flexuosa]|uniref:SUN domain-containing protein n=1 Tax=Onchocerca flexuosa TaxID=387005 RepID=A0A183H7Q4_9BILA
PSSIDISSNVNSSKSKLLAEIRQIRENLRKVSKDLGPITGDTTVLKNEAISIDTERKIDPELLPSYSHEILTDHTIQPLVDSHDQKDAKFETSPASKIFFGSGKMENKHDEQDRSIETATTSVARITPTPEESSKKESSVYNGRKRETITAEIYIRNPKNLKPTIINISDSNKKPKKPCWMILKTYESPSRIFDDDISKQNFDKRIIRIRSDPTLSKKSENREAANFSETTGNIPSTIINIPRVKHEASERIQTETLISSDSDLRSKTKLTVKTQIDTSIKSKIVTSETIRNTTALSDEFQTLITMKTDEICKINHTIAFERLITTDNKPVEICRRGSSIFFIFQYDNNPQILDNLLILFRNELANYETVISAVKYNSSIEISTWNWHATYKILTLNTALFEIITPTNIPIGLWQMIVRYDETSNLCIKYLCILFNPWHKDDETYYPNEMELDEYILNELAIIRKWNQKDAWLLGQFSAICINTILHLLELCLKNNLLKMNELGSSFAIAKAIATAISKFILDVKWDDFQRSIHENEILPSAWTGSKEIMTTYRRMGNRIGYGQSWCYAGLLTSSTWVYYN